MNDTYYDVLGLTFENDPTANEIKKAYRKKALMFHPDKYEGNVEDGKKIFQKICNAYETLSDPIKKKNYDSELEKKNNTEIPLTNIIDDFFGNNIFTEIMTKFDDVSHTHSTFSQFASNSRLIFERAVPSLLTHFINLINNSEIVHPITISLKDKWLNISQNITMIETIHEKNMIHEIEKKYTIPVINPSYVLKMNDKYITIHINVIMPDNYTIINELLTEIRQITQSEIQSKILVGNFPDGSRYKIKLQDEISENELYTISDKGFFRDNDSREPYQIWLKSG